ncbi:TPA: diaminopimelate decarboxylase [Candidatus Poribacteria bacterium]|nr:diaminopimelate decarboxylase [Candidatus Poribacteria bacterium]
MDFFEYRDGELYCEEVKVADICEAVGTPVYLYSHRTLVDHYRKLDTAFAEIEHLICFSVKSNSNLAVIRTLIKEGAGTDIVSGGELFRSLKAGVDPKKVVFAGIGKSKEEIEYALNSDILMFNVESINEAYAINEVAGRLGKKAMIAFRVNPDVEADTHHHITTGKKENKFGIDINIAVEIFRKANELPNLDVCGVHAHIGSQILSSEPYVKSLGKLVPLIDELRQNDINIQNLNIGGGLGVVYLDEKPQFASDFAAAILPMVKATNCRLLLEPGRFITGNSGIMLTKVLYVKRTAAKNFVIVDAAMNDLVRPALYEAYHRIKPIKITSDEEEVVDVVGPICESSDFFAQERKVLKVQQRDYLSLFTAGAYGFTMSSNYNSRPKAAEVLVKDDQYFIVRERETYQDLVKGESIPKFLF